MVHCRYLCVFVINIGAYWIFITNQRFQGNYIRHKKWFKTSHTLAVDLIRSRSISLPLMYVKVVSFLVLPLTNNLSPKAKRAITFTRDDNPPMIPLTISIIWHFGHTLLIISAVTLSYNKISLNFVKTWFFWFFGPSMYKLVFLCFIKNYSIAVSEYCCEYIMIMDTK